MTTLPQIEAAFGDYRAASESRLRELQDENDRLAAYYRETRAEKQARAEEVAARAFGADASGARQLEAQPAHVREHVEAFNAWLRAPKNARAASELASFETRAASGLTGPAGGALVPEVIAGPLAKRLRDISPFRRRAMTISVSSSSVSLVLNNNEAATGWVGETDARPATTDPTVAERAPTFGTVYAYISASEELLMDSAFDVSTWFTDAAGDAIAQAEGVAFLTGNGTKRPTGLLAVAPEAGADGTRTARALRYIPTIAASAFPASNQTDILMNAVYSLKSGYRTNAAWMMNSATAGFLRKLKDSTGQPIWGESIAAGQPASLAGYLVEINEDLPDIGTNTHPILFGDFARAYTICDMAGIRVSVDDNITTPGMVKFYIRRRVGGIVVNEDAVRAIKCAVS